MNILSAFASIRVIRGCLFLLFSSLFLFPSSVLCLAGNEYGKTVFYDDVSVATLTNAPTGLSLTWAYASGGAFTNGAYTNYYRLYGTNLKGRTAVSSNLVATWTGSTNLSNTVAIGWTYYDGIARYVIERSHDSGVTWTNHVTVSPALTNWTDYGTNLWTTGTLSYALSSAPTYPWALPSGTVSNADYAAWAGNATNATQLGGRTETQMSNDLQASWAATDTILSNQVQGVTNALDNYLPLAGGRLTGDLDAGGNNITNVNTLSFSNGSNVVRVELSPGAGPLPDRLFVNGYGLVNAELWNASHDGASSGLDADLLDGQHTSEISNDLWAAWSADALLQPFLATNNVFTGGTNEFQEIKVLGNPGAGQNGRIQMNAGYIQDNNSGTMEFLNYDHTTPYNISVGSVTESGTLLANKYLGIADQAASALLADLATTAITATNLAGGGTIGASTWTGTSTGGGQVSTNWGTISGTNLAVKGIVVCSPTGTIAIVLGADKWISGDGGAEGIYVDSSGRLICGSTIYASGGNAAWHSSLLYLNNGTSADFINYGSGGLLNISARSGNMNIGRASGGTYLTTNTYFWASSNIVLSLASDAVRVTNAALILHGILALTNQVAGPSAPAGGGCLYATNDELWVQSADGTATQISPHPDRTDDIYVRSIRQGKETRINISSMRRQMRALWIVVGLLVLSNAAQWIRRRP